MDDKNARPWLGPTSGQQLAISTYDSGYEHSLEHWVEVRMMVEKAAEDTGEAGIARAMPAAS